MAQKTIQTKEDIRRKMIDVFGQAFPSIKNLSNFPMIVMNNWKNDSLKTSINLHWMWFLPEGGAITYGESGQNRFLYHPTINHSVCGANLNISENIEGVSIFGSDKDNSYTFTLEVKKLSYEKDGKKITGTVMVVSMPRSYPLFAEISKLYTQTYETESIP
jgi:hypothetical protein